MTDKSYVQVASSIFSRAKHVRCALLAGIFATTIARANETTDLMNMSLEELSNVEVTSVSKSAESLRGAPATIYVITHDDIVRSGARSIPEALRLAPNLEVRQRSASNYTAAARGFAGSPSAQNFSNKLLILIDGRSVYSPLFSGVYYDAQDVLLEDVDRIEVISGPGSTLWGANAMNGVINIVTRASSATSGAYAEAGVGNFERNAGLRYGGRWSEDATYRLYAKGFKRDAFELANRLSADDDWRAGQGGFRTDWSRGRDTLTTQGDAYRILENESGTSDLKVQGANLLTRWTHRANRSDVQLQAFFDDTQRDATATGTGFVVHTYDLELQQTLHVGSLHHLIWGAGERLTRYGIANSQTLLFLPPSDTLSVSNLFAQDTIALSDNWALTLGLKFEHDPYINWEGLPELRLAWRVSDDTSLWTSMQRAIRAPTPFDHDVVERLAPNTPDFLTGNYDFTPEKVDAYELGVRSDPWSRLSFSASAFYNEYEDLRTIEPASSAAVLPLHWGNSMRGHTYGVTAWAKWQVTDWWRLAPGVHILREHFEFKPGASRLLGVMQATNDPRSQANLTSSMNLPANFTLDVSARYVSALPNPHLDAYYEADARIGWKITPQLELSLTGFNLLNPRHRESPEPGDSVIQRRVLLEASWSP